PPTRVWADTVSPKANHTHKGASGVSSALMSAVSAAGISREPMVKRVSPSVIWTKPKSQIGKIKVAHRQRPGEGEAHERAQQIGEASRGQHRHPAIAPEGHGHGGGGP